MLEEIKNKNEFMNNYKMLEIWKVSIELVRDIYQLTKKFPKEEIYILTSQIRRCSISIPSNIAEGAGRRGNKEFISFLSISAGSCCELETQLIIAEQLGYVKVEETSALFEKLTYIMRMNVKLIRSLSS